MTDTANKEVNIMKPSFLRAMTDIANKEVTIIKPSVLSQ
jgi:hypothetical protein